MAAEDIDLDAEPEEGKAAEMALALDTLADAEKRVEYAEQEFEKTARSVGSIKERLKKMFADPTVGPDEEMMKDLQIVYIYYLHINTIR